jgi:hypothetical protein
MRTISYLLPICCCAIAVGCGPSQARKRADYVRATLPYDATMLVQAAETLRHENPNSKALGWLDQALRVDLLRFQVCLADPAVPAKDKVFARGVYQQVLAYARKHDVAVGYEPGHEYIVVPQDVALPDRMHVRDIVNSAIGDYGPTNGLSQ